MNLSFEVDEYLSEYYENNTRWIVTLSDGRKVYQDDDRPGIEPASSWIRLGEYLKKNPELKIVGMSVGFRDNFIHLANDCDGYFFVKSVLGSTNFSDNIHFFIVGTLTNGQLWTTMYAVPQMVSMTTEARNPLEAKESLICQPNILKSIAESHHPQMEYSAQTPNFLQNLLA